MTRRLVELIGVVAVFMAVIVLLKLAPVASQGPTDEPEAMSATPTAVPVTTRLTPTTAMASFLRMTSPSRCSLLVCGITFGTIHRTRHRAGPSA